MVMLTNLNRRLKSPQDKAVVRNDFIDQGITGPRGTVPNFQKPKKSLILVSLMKILEVINFIKSFQMIQLKLHEQIMNLRHNMVVIPFEIPILPKELISSWLNMILILEMIQLEAED